MKAQTHSSPGVQLREVLLNCRGRLAFFLPPCTACVTVGGRQCCRLLQHDLVLSLKSGLRIYLFSNLYLLISQASRISVKDVLVACAEGFRNKSSTSYQVSLQLSHVVLSAWSMPVLLVMIEGVRSHGLRQVDSGLRSCPQNGHRVALKVAWGMLTPKLHRARLCCILFQWNGTKWDLVPALIDRRPSVVIAFVATVSPDAGLEIARQYRCVLQTHLKARPEYTSWVWLLAFRYLRD